MSRWTVRRAGPDDADRFLALVEALAEYEQLDPPDRAAQARLVADGFGDSPRFEPYLVDVEGHAVGYAIVFETYSSFLARPTLYLEDLFVLPTARGQGAGGALLRYLAAEAVRRGCGRMEWIVLDWNELARGVYQRIGAQEMEEWRFCRLTGEALQTLAARHVLPEGSPA
ncbi:MAG: GNAT family N-acetyltransferase [Armatimonadetes bacterium]|nr:GNAT family N-acetyltransferase [Armatimonadota bacterium]